jgi:DNA-binding winged helix-turn-helix (wHTH) protein
MGTEATSRPREGGAVHTLRFGVFEMDVRSGELRRNGALVRLQPQPFKVLALLASRPGDVVTREEIQAEVWPAGTFVDFEQSLNFCVRQIRSALGDSAISPRYVETLPRRGYRWVGGAVERVGPPATVHEWPRPVAAEPTNGTGTAAPAETPLPRPRQRLLLAVAAALAASAVGAGWLALRRPPELPPPDFQRVTFRRGALMSARFGPEQQVVYVASWEGQPWGMHVVSAGARESRLLDIDHASVVAASASEVAFIHGDVLARAPLAGGPPREVAQGVLAADWTSDTSEFAIVRMDKDRRHLEYPIDHDLGEITAVGPMCLRLSPDGTMIALEEHVMLGDDRGRVVVVDRDGRELVATDEFASLDGIAWAPSGDEVWFTAAKVGAESELHALSLDGSVRTIFSAMGRLVVHDVAPDGRVLLERTAFRAETFFHRRGEGADRDLSWLDVSGVAGITADGSAILLVESGEGGGPDYTSYLRRTDGSLPVKLGPGNGTSLSPDGKRALVIPLRNPDHVEVVPIGPGEPRVVRIPGVTHYDHAKWLPDGRSFYVSARDAQWRWSAWIVDAGGGEPRKVPLPEGRTLVFDPFSPDGSQFVAPCPEKRLTCVYDTDRGDPHPLEGAGQEYYPIKWDARGIYLRERRHRVPDVLRRLDPRTGKLEVLGELAPLDPAGALGIGHVVVADGGDAWAYSVLRRLSDLYVVTGLH